MTHTCTCSRPRPCFRAHSMSFPLSTSAGLQRAGCRVPPAGVPSGCSVLPGSHRGRTAAAGMQRARRGTAGTERLGGGEDRLAGVGKHDVELCASLPGLASCALPGLTNIKVIIHSARSSCKPSAPALSRLSCKPCQLCTLSTLWHFSTSSQKMSQMK